MEKSKPKSEPAVRASRLVWSSLLLGMGLYSVARSIHEDVLGVDRYKKRRGVAQSGRALGSGPRGRWFKSSLPDSLEVVMDAKEKLSELFERMRSLYTTYQLEKISKAWCQQPREETKRRLASVIELAVELDSIRKTNGFASSLYGEAAIEAVIEGDEEQLRWIEKELSFAGVIGSGHEDQEEFYRKLWGGFRSKVRKALNMN